MMRCPIVQLCDIKLKSLAQNSFSEMSPLPSNQVTSLVENAEKDYKSVPIDKLSYLKRKRSCVKELNLKEESEESESSVEDKNDLKPRKKLVKIISESEDNAEDTDGSEYEIKKVRKNTRKRNGAIKGKKINAKMIKSEDEENEDDDSEPETSRGRSYEKMIERKRAESLAFLKSLKLDEVKAGLSQAVNGVRGRPVKKFEKVFQKDKKKESTPLPLRKSRRLAQLNVDFSEESLYDKAVKEAQEQNNISPIPSEMAFKEATESEEFYESYSKDISLQESQSKEGYVSYDRSILRNLNLEDSNIAKVAYRRITDLAWYPSAEQLILAAGSRDGHLSVWNVESNSSPHLFKIHNDGTSHILFNPFNPVQLFSSSYEGTLRCGDMVKQIFSEVYNVSDEYSCSYFDFLSSTTYLVSLRNGQVALVDNRIEKKNEKKHTCHDYSIKTVDVHPVNKNFFLTAENKGSVRLWDLRKLQKNPVADITHHKRCVNSAFFSPVTGNSILTTSYDDTVCMFNSTSLSQDIKPIKSIKHNNCTGRWLTIFRATWLPNSDDTFVIGSLQDNPRRIQIFNKEMNIHYLMMHDNLTTITSCNVFHPFRPAFAGGNSSGKVFVFK